LPFDLVELDVRRESTAESAVVVCFCAAARSVSAELLRSPLGALKLVKILMSSPGSNPEPVKMITSPLMTILILTLRSQ